nr:immunoglobulin light chain junction region [Macaca mulatta]MOW55735.1 immunoglobulin light chain junction region [Macaca mulatta]
YMQGTQLWTF